jgi:hypothetical protein
MDVDESNFVLTAANLMAIFQQDYVVPEVDAYRYSKIAEIALDGGKCVSGAPLTPAEIFDLLTDDIGLVQDIIGEERDLVITMSVKTSKILNANDKITKRLDVTDFKRGEITTKVQSLDGVPIITVPSARFWSEYTFKTGGTGQEAGGFEKTPDAVPIQWIITAKQAPIAVSKTEAVRIFEPENNPKADAWKVDYRKYHDLWIPQNKLDGVLVRLEQEEDGE